MNLEIQKRLALLERETIDYLLEATKKSPDVILSSSGGLDSEVMYYIIKKFNIAVKGIFFNKSIENKNNNIRLREQKKHFENIYEAKTESYNSIVSRLGFPIENKNFSDMCHRLRNTKPNNRNIIDKYRLIVGTSPLLINFKEEITKSKRLQVYSIPLNMWYLALNYPIQAKCCDILKKAPAKKNKRDMIVGIMASDSMQRRKAIKGNFSGKYFPLKNWNKSDVVNYVKLHNVPHSKAYDDRDLANGITIIGATNTGCQECHFGQHQRHFIKVNGEIKKTSKFEILRIEKPKAYKAIMNRTHTETQITFEETIQVYEDSKNDIYLEESIELRNKYIKEVLALMEKNEPCYLFHPLAIPTLKALIIN